MTQQTAVLAPSAGIVCQQSLAAIENDAPGRRAAQVSAACRAGAVRLVDVRMRAAEPVSQLPPLRGVDVQAVQFGDGEPADVAGLVVGLGLAADRAAQEDHLVFLADLAVGVGDDVAGIGVDAQDASHLDGDAGLFAGLPDSAFGDGLAKFLLPHRDGPLAGIAAALEQDPAVPVAGEDAGGGHQLVQRCLLGLLAALVRSDLSKDAELLVLRHENQVLHRPPADRLWLAALSGLVPPAGGVRCFR
jgi:hypothetical protein